MNRSLSLIYHFRYFLKGWKEIFSNAGPIFITFFVTSKCNANCDHCLYWQRINKTDNELTLEEIDKISNSIPPFPKLLLSGGEPFMRNDIDEICEIFYLNNKVKQITIPTNGILSEVIFEKVGNILKTCKKTHIQMQISFDGVGEIHDRIRKFPNAFNKMMQTYYYLKRLEKEYGNLEIDFCFTFSSVNQGQIINSYDYLISKGNGSFSTILVREPVENKSLLDFDFKKYVEGNEYIYRNSDFKMKNLSEILFMLRRIQQMKIIEGVVRGEKNKFNCTAGTLTAVIDEVGNVYPCETHRQPFGTLREMKYDFRSIWKNKIAKEFRQKLSLDKCSCTHESNTMTNISFSLPFYFKFPLEYLRLKLK